MKPTTIVLAEDHAMVRAGIRLMIERIPDVQIVAEAKDGSEAVELVRKHRPDILIADIAMPQLNGIDAALRIGRELPQVRTIILSMYSTEEHVYQALKAGVAGYLLKQSAPSELEIAINAVAQGRTYLSPPITQHVVAQYRDGAGEAEHPLSRLTSRQREVLQLLAEGFTTKEVARALKLSSKTAENHRARIMERLGIHDLPGLVRFAIRNGLAASE